MNSVSIAINDFKKQLCGVGIEIKLVLPYQNLFIALLRCNVPFFYFSFFSFFFFFLEYSKNERLYLGEFQRGRACFLRRDGAARAREGSPRAQHQEGLGTRGH